MSSKYHIAKRKYVIDILASIMGSVFVFGFVFSLIVDETEEAFEVSDINAFILVGCFLIALILQLVLYWMILKRHVFSDQEKSFLIEKGLFFKRKANIPYKNIHAIALKRSFINLILGLSTLEIDTGTTASLKSEGRLILDKRYAIVLKDYLENKKHDDSLILPSPDLFDEIEHHENKDRSQLKWYHLMLLGLIKPGFLAFILGATIIVLGGGFITMQLVDDVDLYQNYGNLLFVFFGLIIIYMLLTVFYHLIKYYHYTYYVEEDYIFYAYGLINKVEFKIPIKRVNGVHIDQSILFRLFGFYQLNASIIGIGDFYDAEQSKSESKSILLLARLDQVNEVLDKIGFKVDKYDVELVPNKFKYLNFIILPMLLLFLLNLIPYVVLDFSVIRFIIPVLIQISVIMLAFIGTVLLLKQHKIQLSSHVFLFQRGAFTKKITIVKKQRIQMLSYTQSPILIIEKIGNIFIGYKDIRGFVMMHSFNKDQFLMMKNYIIDL